LRGVASGKSGGKILGGKVQFGSPARKSTHYKGQHEHPSRERSVRRAREFHARDPA